MTVVNWHWNIRMFLNIISSNSLESKIGIICQENNLKKWMRLRHRDCLQVFSHSQLFAVFPSILSSLIRSPLIGHRSCTFAKLLWLALWNTQCSSWRPYSCIQGGRPFPPRLHMIQGFILCNTPSHRPFMSFDLLVPRLLVVCGWRTTITSRGELSKPKALGVHENLMYLI